jgi:hypothetical protein
MEDTLEYWQAVKEQHELHIQIALNKINVNDEDVKNSKLAIEEAIFKINELS